MTEFAHLHVHSYYSLLDGCTSPVKLARAAAQAGMPALALTDHGALYGAVEFYDACREAGIQPVTGLELPLDVGDRVPDSLVLLACDREGYANLCRLSSALQTRPERESLLRRGLPVAALEGHTAGLLALSGGKQGRIDRLVREGHADEAERAAAAWAERFGKAAFFLELQMQTPGDAEVAAALAALAARLGVLPVATGDVHYLLPEQAHQGRLLAAMAALRPFDEIPQKTGLHLAGPEEIATTFAGFPDAIANTVAVAQQCRLELPLGRAVFPEIDLPPGLTAGGQLGVLAEAGAVQRYGSLNPAVRFRLDHELGIIDGMGYAPLFLIVADVVRFAHEQGVPINSRGSAAGSLVAYCLGISAVDPVALDLYFERFLNPERRDPPDIDLDLGSERRDEVIQYIYRRFGQDRVATICTYARLHVRSAWREVAKA